MTFEELEKVRKEVNEELFEAEEFDRLINALDIICVGTENERLEYNNYFYNITIEDGKFEICHGDHKPFGFGLDTPEIKFLKACISYVESLK